MASLTEKKLDFWISHNLNVLFKGKHGVGKTTIITDAFTQAGLRWKYFSAATMDPWVDFIGVPKSVMGENGTEYLDLVRPREFAEDEVEALFFDEYNRAPKKVRNAVMELIQFKSINGKKFKNLRVVWAAINPNDGNDQKYDVDEIDPAQQDRFQVQVELPYQPSKHYFEKKFGSLIANASIEWWKSLSAENQNEISPRRLDYALEIYRQDGDLRDVLPKVANISELLVALSSGPVSEKLKQLLADGDHKASAEWLGSENNCYAAIPPILRNNQYMSFFLPDFSDEKLSSLIVKEKAVLKYVLSSLNTPKFQTVLQMIVDVNQNKTIAKKIVKAMKKAAINQSPQNSKNPSPGNSCPDAPYFHTQANTPMFQNILASSMHHINSANNTLSRKRSYNEICAHIPDVLSTKDAKDVLSFIDIFCQRSHLKTCVKLSHLPGVINHCISQLLNNGEHKTSKDFWTNRGSLYCRLYGVVASTSLNKRVFCI